MNKRATVAVLSLLAVGVAGAMPALAGPQAKAKKGTWSFTDATPDPTPDASLGADSNHCHGKLPAAPTDVNAHTVKVKKRATLSVDAQVIGDWAMEVLDAKGTVVAGDDSNPPASEGVAGVVLKKGTYRVVLCNLSGAPTATADYTLVGR
jgi:hypothetical protein